MNKVSIGRLSVLNTINPSTEKHDLKGALRFIVEKLNEDPEIVKDGLFHKLSGGMTKKLNNLGISETYRPDFLQLAQYLGILFKSGHKAGIQWEVICITYADECLKPHRIEAAFQRLIERHALNNKNAKLRMEIKKLKAGGDSEPADQVDTSSIEKIAELVAIIENLREENLKKDKAIEKQKVLLSKKETVDPEKVIAGLMKKAHEGLKKE